MAEYKGYMKRKPPEKHLKLADLEPYKPYKVVQSHHSYLIQEDYCIKCEHNSDRTYVSLFNISRGIIVTLSSAEDTILFVYDGKISSLTINFTEEN